MEVDSKWKFTKEQSAWHFDPARSPVLDLQDSYLHVCRFAADFTVMNESLLGKAVVRGALDTGDLPEAKRNDLERVGADPNLAVGSRWGAAGQPLCQKMAYKLGLGKDADIAFHNQTMGQMWPMHIDYWEGMDLNLIRFMVFTADWQLGQIFQAGNATFANWRAGDCISWSIKDIPHGSCNFGWWDRPTARITGVATEKTRELIARASKDLVIEL